jgi:4-oxalocrotonate tautomerase
MAGLVPAIPIRWTLCHSDRDHADSPVMTNGNEPGNQKETTMPEITINLAAGRTEEQKRGMMVDITQALVKNLGVDAEAVVIQINEAPLSNKIKGGQTYLERQKK